MFEGRMFIDSDEPVGDYEFTDPETGENLESPFPVITCTLKGEFLGYGHLVGQLSAGEYSFPVIEIEDESAATGKVHLLGGVECGWQPASPEIIEQLPSDLTDKWIGAQEYSYTLDVANRARLQ